MKRSIVTFLLVGCCCFSWAQQNLNLAKPRVIKNPEVEYTPSWLEVNTIELTKEATVLHGHLRNQPHYWAVWQTTSS